MKQLKPSLSNHIFLNGNLDFLSRTLQMRKAHFPHQAVTDNAAGDANLTFVGFQLLRRTSAVFVHQPGGRIRPAKLPRIRLMAKRLNRFKLLHALRKLVAWLEFQRKNILSPKSETEYSGAKHIGARKRTNVNPVNAMDATCPIR